MNDIHTNPLGKFSYQQLALKFHKRTTRLVLIGLIIILLAGSTVDAGSSPADAGSSKGANMDNRALYEFFPLTFLMGDYLTSR